MTPTRPGLLVVLAVLAAAIGWAMVEIIYATWTRIMPVPWTATITMAVLAVALVVWALLLRPRIAALGKRTEVGSDVRPVNPLVVARTAVLAMAASRTGALVVGFYTGVAISLATRTDRPYAVDQLIAAVATVAAAICVVLAALWLESICRLPEDPDDQPPTAVSPADEDWVVPNHMASRPDDQSLPRSTVG